MRVFSLEFPHSQQGDDRKMFITVGVDVESEDVFLGRTFGIPEGIADPWADHVHQGILDIAKWASSPPNMVIPEWQSPKHISGVEYENEAIQIVWESELNNIVVVNSVAVSTYNEEIAETLSDVHDSISNVLQEIDHLLVVD